MNYLDMKESVDSAKQTLRMADIAVERLIPMMVGRLRVCSSYNSVEALKDLKKELKNFNAVTGQWK